MIQINSASLIMRTYMRPYRRHKKKLRPHEIDERWSRTFNATNRDVALLASNMSKQ